MTASLLDFPPELLTHIVSYLDKSVWLLNCGLSCRTLYRLVQRDLNTRVSLGYSLQEGHRQLRLFTNRILKSPDLGLCVRELALEPSPYEDSPKKLDEQSFKERPNNLYDVVASFSTSDEDRDAWWNSLQESTNQEGWLSLLMLHLPNLERLDLVIPEEEKTRFCAMLDDAFSAKSSFGHRLPFSSLKIVDMEYCWDYDVLSFKFQILQLPSLREFYGTSLYGCDPMGQKWPDLAGLESKNHSLTRLELYDCSFDRRHLTHILHACKNLRTLAFAVSEPIGVPVFHDETIPIGRSLENLRIDLETKPFGDDTWLQFSYEIPCLASLHALKNLRTDMAIILGEAARCDESDMSPEEVRDLVQVPKFFPSSIETLCFTTRAGNPRMLMRALVGLLQKKALYTPRLRLITIEDHGSGFAGYDMTDFIALGIDPCIETVEAEPPPPKVDEYWRKRYAKSPYTRVKLHCDSLQGQGNVDPVFNHCEEETGER